MNKEISQELKWRVECRGAIIEFNESGQLATNMIADSLRNAFFRAGYLAACKKRQEEREDAFKAFILDIAEDYERQLEKRDKLLKQAKFYVEENMHASSMPLVYTEQWLSDYEELQK